MELEQVLADIRAALGIDETADPVAAIAAINTRATDAESALAAAGPDGADAGELVRLRRELADTNTRYLQAQGESRREVAQIRADMRNQAADAEMDRLVATGRILNADRDRARSLYLSTPTEDWPNVVAMFRSVDLTERGIATGTELAELELSEQDVANAKALGNWNADDPKASRLALMKAKAAQKGWQLPDDYGK